jgi:hypothetical protein
MMSLLAAMVLSLSTPLFAENTEIGSMAGILLEMNHFPNEAQTAALQAIMADSQVDASVRVIAKAIRSIKHQATAQDKQVLSAIAADDKKSAGTRTLAGVVINFNHQVTAFQKPQLEALVSAGDGN